MWVQKFQVLILLSFCHWVIFSEEFHGVHYNLDSVKEIANLADRYIKKFETLENSDKPYKLTQYQISQFNNVKIKELNLVNCRL